MGIFFLQLFRELLSQDLVDFVDQGLFRNCQQGRAFPGEKCPGDPVGNNGNSIYDFLDQC
jgi:hypothetical protein